MSGRAVLTAAAMRDAEERAFAGGIKAGALMEAAGTAVATFVINRFPGREVVVACGPGNNGGDGYVIARVLRAAGHPVRVAAWRPPTTVTAGEARDGWDGPIERLQDVTGHCSVLVDALFGIGADRPLPDEIAGWLRNTHRDARIAVDVPSGLSTDSGAVLTDVPLATHTIALGALKPAHVLAPGIIRCGEVIVAPLGIPALADPPSMRTLARPMLAAPTEESHKYNRGKVVVIGGEMPGAAMLSALAAQRSGAGYVELVADVPVADAAPHALVRRPWSIARLEDRRTGAVLIGPGLGMDDAARAKLESALGAGLPLVLDADALTLLCDEVDRLRTLDVPIILTPHAGEFARLFGDPGADPLGAVTRAAARTGAVVMLKGATTIMAAPDERIAIAPLAPAWLASAGTGDVLAGIVATMLAQRGLHGFDPLAAASAGTWLHGRAADHAGPALIADDLIHHLPRTIGECL